MLQKGGGVFALRHHPPFLVKKEFPPQTSVLTALGWKIRHRCSQRRGERENPQKGRSLTFHVLHTPGDGGEGGASDKEGAIDGRKCT